MKMNHIPIIMLCMLSPSLLGALVEKQVEDIPKSNSKEVQSCFVGARDIPSLIGISPKHEQGITRQHYLRLDRPFRLALRTDKTSISPDGRLVCNIEGHVIHFLNIFPDYYTYSRENSYHIIGDYQTVYQSQIACLDDQHVAIYNNKSSTYKIFNYLTRLRQIGNSLGACKKIQATPHQNGFLIDSCDQTGNPILELVSTNNPSYPYLIFKGHTGINNSFAMAKRANRLATGSSDKKIYVCDFQDTEMITTHHIQLDSKPTLLEFDPEGNYLCVATQKEKNWVLIFDAKKLTLLETIHLEPTMQHSRIGFTTWNKELLIQTQWGQTYSFAEKLKAFLLLKTFCLNHLKKQGEQTHEKKL